ncbi:MAG: response regulator [Candidatus Omnitrophica bacterium]|nr:response regulator [Candidatus Omnitrophota bacterium]MDD3988099.1 response regulator [Candidatus Omnitrophota bacterium]
MAKKRIFIADDQSEVLSLLKDFLTTNNFDVMTCREPKNVLRLIRSFKPQLILLDLLMPDLGGFEVCEILNNEPETRGIPIIVISGLSDSLDIKKAYKLGVVDYLVKPFSLDSMLKKISQAIANKEKLF